jgi:hypothetical protein
MMPVLSYFTVVGSTLVALLMLADGTLEKSARLPNKHQRCGVAPTMAPSSGKFAGSFSGGEET